MRMCCFKNVLALFGGNLNKVVSLHSYDKLYAFSCLIIVIFLAVVNFFLSFFWCHCHFYCLYFTMLFKIQTFFT